MAVAYETIRSEVERLRNYVINDLDLLVNQNVGGAGAPRGGDGFAGGVGAGSPGLWLRRRRDQD